MVFCSLFEADYLVEKDPLAFPPHDLLPVQGKAFNRHIIRGMSIQKNLVYKDRLSIGIAHPLREIRGARVSFAPKIPATRSPYIREPAHASLTASVSLMRRSRQVEPKSCFQADRRPPARQRRNHRGHPRKGDFQTFPNGNGPAVYKPSIPLPHHR